jgi:tetratricopeptide (TPR) repeat protein
MMRKIIAIAASLLILITGGVHSQEKDSLVQLNTLMESYRFTESIALVNLYLVKDSTRPDFLLIKGQALSSLFRYKEAITALTRANQSDSTNIGVLNELVNVYRQSGDPDKAIETCRKISTLVPDNRYFTLQLANLCYNNKDYREAIWVLLPLYSNDTSDFYLTKQLAYCYEELKLPDSALLFYRKALGTIPYDPIVTGKLANLYIRIKEVNTAYYLTALFLKKDPENVAILKINAYCNYLIHDYEAAAKQLKVCMNLGDSSKFTYKYLGLSYYKQDKFDTAAPFLLSAFRIDTTDAENCFYYGVSETRSYMPDTGLVYLFRTMRILMPPPKFQSAIYAEIASAYNGTGKADTAVYFFQNALRTDPDNNNLLFKIAYQYDYFLRKPQEAIPWYRKFIKNESSVPEQDAPQAIYGKPVITNGIPEISVSLVDYAKNRVKEISNRH